ncbi:MAG: hypothetical protein ABJN62_02675 [Halioglobus sp.]
MEPATAAMLVTPSDYSGVLKVSMLAYLIAAIAIIVVARYLRAH